MLKEQLLFSLKNPILSGHQVYDRCVLPGLAYIDILYQGFKKQGHPFNELEIRNLTIHRPLTVAPEERTPVAVEIREKGPGRWNVEYREKDLLAVAEVVKAGRFIPGDRLDIPALQQRASRRYPIGDLYGEYREKGLVHQGLMAAEGMIWESDSEMLLFASLPAEAMQTAGRFLIHPALIDAGAIATLGLCKKSAPEDNSLYLPLCYESFRAASAINHSCYAYVSAASLRRQHELLSLTIHFYDPSGTEIARLHRLTGKRTERSQLHKNDTPASFDLVPFLQLLVAARLNNAPETIDTKAGYYDLGLQSAVLLDLTTLIGQQLGVDLPPTLLFEHPNIASLAEFLQREYQLPAPVLHAPAPTAPSADHASPSPVAAGSRDIAIIGMAGRYPGARDLQEFWDNLLSGKDSISEIPPSRWSNKDFDGIRSPSGKNISGWGGFIDDVDCFDPRFFRISAREAELMDPQERLFLEICWAALEDAGYTPQTLAPDRNGRKGGRVGVFAGVMHKDYTLIGHDRSRGDNRMPLPLSNAAIANRVSYFCNFRGPSMAVDSVCSSSLVAIHLAIQSLLSGECEAAFAGGVNLSLHPAKYLSYGLIDMHSSEGRCRSFGKGGDGYVSAEGVGALLLKPLEQAVRDNDQIHAVIRGSSVNHCGSTGGMTVPSPTAQAELIADCLAKAHIHPRTLSYIEAHGTGTSLGDPIEIQGLTRAFSATTADTGFCAIGSVKSNIGNAESAAGISGLTKVALQLKHRMLVPSIHSREINPYLDLANSPFYVQQTARHWDQPQMVLDGHQVTCPRRGGISSFGASGTNAHLILEEYIPVDPSPIATPHMSIIPLSARNPAELTASIGRLHDHIRNNLSVLYLPDIAFTLQAGRLELEERIAFVVDSTASLLEQMTHYLGQGHAQFCFRGNSRALHDDPPSPAGKSSDGEYLLSLAKAWVGGGPVRWPDDHASQETGGGRRPRRISLPGYPFAKEHYWINSPLPPLSTSPEAPPADHNMPRPADPHLPGEGLAEKTIHRLKELFAGIVKFKAGEIDENAMMENYGIDSIMIVEMNKALAAIFQQLPSTLLYEYKTLSSLGLYLAKDHPEKCMDWTGLSAAAGISAASAQPTGHRPAIPIPASQRPGREPIAIIGLSGRYPQADNLSQFWDNLLAGKDCITEIPADRWKIEGFFEPDAARAVASGKSYGKWGGFINGFADFDPLFFKLTPKDAAGLDPQVRLFLESCWEVLEDAGYTRQKLMDQYNGNVGVFAGVTRASFSLYGPQLMKEGNYALNSMSSMANRVSYFFNFKGPSLPIDTMCSSSLTAIHLACESLEAGACEMAIAGGVNLLLHPTEYVMLSANNFLSSSGRCRSFGADGDGYVPAEGVGAVLLKPLSRAVADGDAIYAVIKGTAVNHGGKTNGYTVPNPVAQGELIRSALDNAGVNARDISYMEAHGTGTSLGDPIELAGLSQAFRADTAETQFCSIGSVKSNIGHPEAAAGIAGLTKILLQLQHQALVPSLHSDELNPNINIAGSPFFLQRQLSEWRRPVMDPGGAAKELPRVAGLSSFGAGGSNAHMIVQEYIPDLSTAASAPAAHPGMPVVILLSAANAGRLNAYASRLLEAFRRNAYADDRLPDIAYTLQTGREPLAERLAMEVRSMAELTAKLGSYVSGHQQVEGIYTGNIKENKEILSVLGSGQDLEAIVSGWMRNKRADKLMAVWVKGIPADWEQWYTAEHGRASRPSRMHLPTYPFERKRYWFKELPAGPAAPETEVPGTQAALELPARATSFRKEEEPYSLMGFREDWEASECAATDTAPVKTLVCVLTDDALRQSFLSSARRISKDTAVLFVSIPQPNDKEAYREAFSRILPEHGAIDAVVYARALEDDTAAQDHFAIAVLLQGLCEARITVSQVLLAGQWTVASSFDHVPLSCYLESWIGFERSTGLVLPGTRVRGVFVETSAEKPDIEDWARKIFDELSCLEKKAVLYRNGRRYVSRITPSPLPSEALPVLQPGATCLITGGMGRLGLLFARHLAGKYAAKLILTGRSPLDSAKREALQALEAAGSRIFYLQADIGDPEQMRQGLIKARGEFGPVSGVIHTAGALGAQLLQDKTEQGFAAVLAPKIRGTILLDELLKDEPLAFTCYFSSISAILGDFGACDYSIANRFQMAYAAHRQRMTEKGLRKGSTIAINWPLWQDGGMDLASEENTRLYLKSSGQRYLATEEGLQLFEKLISQESAHQMIIAGQESKVKRYVSPPDTPQTIQRKEIVRPVQRENITRTNNITQTIEKEDIARALEQELLRIAGNAQEIPVDMFNPDDNLADLGYDSISLTRLAMDLSAHFEVTIAPAVFFGYSSIRKLTEYFLKEHPALVASRYGGSTPAPPASKPPAPGEAQHTPDPLPEIYPRNGASEPIAIIGMSGRFPDARNIDEMWNILSEGKDAVREIPADRWDWRKYYSPGADDPEKTNCKWTGLVPGIAEFDPAFFEISPREAEGMDPRQRLLMQEAWKALEDAGYGPSQLAQNRIGLFVGAEEGGNGQLSGAQGLTSNHNAILAARLSYFLDLGGPNMAINTACSSGLVAAHQAFQSLQLDECDTAIAAGVNLMIYPELYVAMTRAGMLSDDGKCHAFDKSANGMVPGDAVVAIVMKRLSRAKADGDPIYAVVRASGINFDGRTNGITAPNGLAQQALFTSVYDRGGIDPANIEYVVTHGTGTRLGDPVEINALQNAFKARSRKKNYCAITSVKSNFGHTFAASGLVNIVSLVQAFRHQIIPGGLHCKEESDYIDWKESCFYVNKANREWKTSPGKELLGAVNAFGMSGTNAHMVLSSYTRADANGGAEAPFYLFVLSAKSPQAFKAKATELADALEGSLLAGARLKDVAYTLLAGRHHFKYRMAIVTGSKEELVALLRSSAEKQRQPGVLRGEVSRDFVARSSIRKCIGDLCSSGGRLKSDAPMIREDLTALAEFYCQGYDIPPRELYLQLQPAMIHLPTYPFLRDAYWPAPAANGPVSGTEQPAAREGTPSPVREATPSPVREGFSPLVYEEAWEEEPPGETSPPPPSGVWLAFLTSEKYRTALLSAVGQAGCEPSVIFIASPEAKDQLAFPTAYRLPDQSEEAWTTVLRAVRERYGVPDSIFYGYPLEDAASGQDYHALFCLIRAIKKEKMNALRFILAGACDQAASVESCYLESLIGLQRTAGTVLPGICFRYVLQVGPTILPELFRNILREWNISQPATVLYRGNRRLVPVLRQIALPAAVPPLRTGGTYLLTGGTGGLGWLVAKQLAANWRASLVLVGRSAYDATREKRIRELESMGGRAIYIQADVGRPDDMAAALEKAHAHFGTLNGVIHAAGVAAARSVFQEEFSRFEEVLHPKIDGTIVLDNFLADETLDFVCYFSSGTAIMGDFGTCSYAIANRFQQAYAAYRDRLRSTGARKGRTVVIAWPLWREGGMNLGDEEMTGIFLRSTGQRLLESTEGLQLMERILAQQKTQFLVLTGSPPQDPATGALPAGRAAAQGPDIGLCIETEIKRQIQQLLRTPPDQLDIYANFMEMGFDSILLTQLAKTLSSVYSLPILPSVFFGYPSIETLTSYLLTTQGSRMQEIYGQQSAASAGKPSVMDTAPTDIPQTEIAPGNIPQTEIARGNIPPTGTALTNATPPDSMTAPIAIIGMSGRFPGAANIAEMWDILQRNKHSVTLIPADRLSLQPGEEGTRDYAWSGLISNIDEFDPLFFELSPKEAVLMDPRQRLLLQESWKALEDAGYGPHQLKAGRVGFYVGAEESSYAALVGAEGNLTANNNAILAARLSYFLNLSGPNMAINTACSSGLVAVHQACMSLRNGECDSALAAGVNLLITPEPYAVMNKAGMLSGSGRCRTFDKHADGMVPAEAVAVVVLKKLSQALADGDPIYATILGSGLNYDGKTNGITAPSGLAQTQLLKSVYDRFRVDPSDMRHIVTHGTATPLGDSVEVGALHDAFRSYGSGRSFCALTSTKTNFGHTLAASGLVSLIGMVQSLVHCCIPASLHCEEDNEYIDWGNSPFFINKKNLAWPATPGEERKGAVSAFGMSGTNAHVILESYSMPRESSPEEMLPANGAYFLLLSGKTLGSLEQRAQDLAVVLQQDTPSRPRLCDVAYTCLAGRHHFRYRCALVVRDYEEAIRLLKLFVRGQREPAIYTGEVVPDFRAQASVKEYIATLAASMGMTGGDPQNKLEIAGTLAQFYCQGYELPADLQTGLPPGNNAPRRIHLPAYPFARDKYWVHTNGKNAERPGPVPDAASLSAPTAQDDTHLIRSVISGVLELPEHRIEPDIRLEFYGLDSIVMMQLKNHLQEIFGEIPAGLFYEYPTLRELAGYFRHRHAVADPVIQD